MWSENLAIYLAKYIRLAKWVWLKKCCNKAAGLAVWLASDQQADEAHGAFDIHSSLSCDVICMSPLNRACGTLSLSSICRSFFLPPRRRWLWAARTRRTPFLRSQRNWSDFWSCFLGLCHGYNKSVIMRVRESLYFHLCECVYVCEYDNYDGAYFRVSSSAPLRLTETQRQDERPQREKQCACVRACVCKEAKFTWQKFIAALLKCQCLKKTLWGKGSWLWVCGCEGERKRITEHEKEMKPLIPSLSQSCLLAFMSVSSSHHLSSASQSRTSAFLSLLVS